MGALTDEYENKIKADCEQLYVVLKNCDGPDQQARDGESVKSLYRLVFLLSYRQGSKLMAITTTTASYLCHHPMLPVILVEILRDSKNINVCAHVLDVLGKLVLKNAVVNETDRKAIRRCFHEAHHFRTVIQALRNMDTRFQPICNKLTQDQETDDNDSIKAHDMQVKFLKIINCMYSRKGQSQIALISDFTVEFLGRHFVKHAQRNLEISRCMLPLIKTICRNRKNCVFICNESFIKAFVSLVPAVKRYASGITIIRFLSRSPEALVEMSRVESMHYFIVDTAIHHSEKSTHRKYLMGAMYRLAKTSYGMQLLKNTSLWFSLLEFFMKSERLEELRQRMSFTRAYTILHRGVPNKFVNVSPLLINFHFPREIQSYICDRANHHSSDDSDNDEEDDDDEQRNARSRTVSAENEDEDNDDSDNDNENDDEQNISDMDEDDITNCNQNNEITYNEKQNGNITKDFGKFFSEFNIDEKTDLSNKKFEDIEGEIHRHHFVDRLALPDLLPHIDNYDDGSLSTQCNIYSSEQLKIKVKDLKEHMTNINPNIIYDLDSLIKHATDVTIPTLEEVRLNYLNQRANKMASNCDSLKFESRFECGNLRRVEQMGEYEYNLYISPDVNMACGLQWFYFQVTGMRPQQTYAFNIVNLQKCNSQFSYGLQPVMFSTLDYAFNSHGWHKCGTEVMYYGNEYISREENKQFRTLRFCITFDYDDDVCYFAYHFPYTYTRLMRVVLAIFTLPIDGVYSRVEELTRSIGGFNSVPLITITSKHTGDVAIEDRKLVFLTSRVHPGESNASWIIEGAIRFLLSDDASAILAREHYVFKIIPILNPEGVIYGNTRCGLTGNDLNRCWKKPHPRLHPEIYNCKQLVQYAREHLPNEIFTFIDIHGHSRKKHFFFYGCDGRQSWNEADAMLDHTDSYNALPTAMAAINPNMKLSYCRNTVERKRETTCRVVMWREFAIQRSHTLECSFCSGENKTKITTGMLREIGASIVKTLAQLTTTTPQMAASQ